MTHKTFNWNQNDTTFFGQYWQVENPKAVIALVHGMGEHSSRYENSLVPSFNSAGFTVIALDQFGHGKTLGKRGHCPSSEAVLDSVDNLLAKSKEFFGAELPTFLYGHSMGGNVVSNYLIRRKYNLKGAIISSPMLKLAFDPPAWKMIAGKFMRNIYPAFQEATGLDSSAISRDPKEVEIYDNDPLIHDKITVNFSLPFFEAGDYAIENASKIEIPCLIVHGTGDQLTDYKGSQSFAENGGNNLDLKLYEGGYHELHNDLVKEELKQDLLTWLNKQV